MVLKRLVRKGDFRASGSGENSFMIQIDKDTLAIAFDIANKLKLQSVAFDFIYSNEGYPFITEMSYGYGTRESQENAKGFWDKDLNWHSGQI